MDGVWRQEAKGRRLQVTIEPFTKLPAWARRAAEGEAEHLAAWSGRQLELDWPGSGSYRWSSWPDRCGRTDGVNAPPPTTRRNKPGSRARATGTNAYGRGT